MSKGYVEQPLLTFDQIAQRADFSKIYSTAINIAKIWERLNDLDKDKTIRPLKILDIGGGIGVLGRMLTEEFGPFIEYVNVDTDSEALILSVGRKVNGSYLNLPQLLSGEKFDYVFSLNLIPEQEICGLKSAR